MVGHRNLTPVTQVRFQPPLPNRRRPRMLRTKDIERLIRDGRAMLRGDNMSPEAVMDLLIDLMVILVAEREKNEDAPPAD